MSANILATKLYIPVPQPGVVSRPRLVERLNEGLHRKMTLVSAAAGFGKSTLVSDWAAACGRPVAWLSLDESDSDPARFLIYLIAAIQTVAPDAGADAIGPLQSPQPPPAEAVLTVLLNDIAAVQNQFVLVLDDLHAVDSIEVNRAVVFLVEHLPPQMHLVIATREDPPLPLSRLRARGQLTEIRAVDLRFTSSEAVEFLQRVNGLSLLEDDIVALETRTEGWIAGLQLAAISMQGLDDAAGFIKSFTGSHRFVLDYLVDEVLHQQPEHIQEFLLNTAILDRMCGSLCDAILCKSSRSGQATLEYLEHANLFLVPLDNERRWFRYHHLFGDLLRQQLQQRAGDQDVADLHKRASEWFAAHGLEIEAFHHAAAGHDIEGAERLIKGGGSPLFVRGGAVPVLNWLESLPAATLDARPWLWVTLATVLSVMGKISRVEQHLQAAESVLHTVQPPEMRNMLVHQIENLRELLGLLVDPPHQADATISRLSGILQRPETAESSSLWKLGLAFQQKGNFQAARQAFSSAVSISEASGNVHGNILAVTSLGKMLEHDGQLNRAAECYRRALHLAGNPPGSIACEAHAGLSRISCEWNDLEAAWTHGTQSLQLARQIEIASFVSSELTLARVQLARGDVSEAAESLANTSQSIRNGPFEFRMPEVADLQIQTFIRLGNLAAAEALVRQFDLPIGTGRLLLAQGDAAAALAAFASYRRKTEDEGWGEERIRTTILQSLAHHALGDADSAIMTLSDALAMAEPGGYVRSFVDEGPRMQALLAEALTRGIMVSYTRKLLAVFDSELQPAESRPPGVPAHPLAELLTEREKEMLQLIAQGLSNHQIAEQLFVSLNTVKGHNRNLFGKLNVQRRTEAVARARELGLI